MSENNEFSTNMFEIASRRKYRFSIPNNLYSYTVEDLWDMSLNDLDSIWRDLNLQVATSHDYIELSDLEIKTKIVSKIVKVKLMENHTAEKAKKFTEAVQKLREIVSQLTEDKSMLANDIIDQIDMM